MNETTSARPGSPVPISLAFAKLTIEHLTEAIGDARLLSDIVAQFPATRLGTDEPLQHRPSVRKFVSNGEFTASLPSVQI